MSPLRTHGQTAVEFLIVFSFVFAFFIIMQSYANGQQANAEQQHTTVLATRLARQWATTLLLATYTRGYYAELTAPSAVDSRGTAYTLTIRNSTVAVRWMGERSVMRETLVPLQAIAVYNASGATAFNLTPGLTYRVNGTNGVVWVV